MIVKEPPGEPACFLALRCARPVGRWCTSDPVRSSGSAKLEGDGCLRQAGSSRLSRAQHGIECQARCQAEGVFERKPPSPPPAIVTPLIAPIGCRMTLSPRDLLPRDLLPSPRPFAARPARDGESVRLI